VRFFNYEGEQGARAGLWLRGRGYDLAELLGLAPFGPLSRHNIGEIEGWRRELGEEPAARADAARPLAAGFRWLPPVMPITSFRDFYAFEQHVATARARRGLEVPEAWYRMPVFYFSNANALFGHDAKIPIPPDGEWMDYELEVGAVLGEGGRDLDPGSAEALIAGYCVLADWSARKVQRTEMSVGLGPAKGKDFATSIGPFLVTPDEFKQHRAGKGFDLTMRASVNGRELSRGNWSSIHYSFGEMIAQASRGVELLPGELFGSGTVGSGCILELGADEAGGWLEDGDQVELEITGLGKLRGTMTATKP
jgi:fumarylacetoacetate (FAA) hydrolase